MFDKLKFSKTLNDIISKYESSVEFAEKSKVNRTYISKYINLSLNSPPSPDILKRISDNSKGIITYIELMIMCNYIDLNDFFHLTENLEVSNLCDMNIIALEKELDFSKTDIQQLVELSNADINDKYDKISNILSKYPKDKVNKFYEVCQTQKSNISPLLQRKKYIKIPVLGYVAAGTPIEAIENIIGQEEISEEMAKKGDFFGLVIKGDSMFPYIIEEDILIVKKQNDCESGDIAVVLVNGNEATVKKIIKHDNSITLQPFNPMYPPINYNIKQIEELPVKIIGKFAELRRKKFY